MCQKHHVYFCEISYILQIQLASGGSKQSFMHFVILVSSQYMLVLKLFLHRTIEPLKILNCCNMYYLIMVKICFIFESGVCPVLRILYCILTRCIGELCEPVVPESSDQSRPTVFLFLHTLVLSRSVQPLSQVNDLSLLYTCLRSIQPLCALPLQYAVLYI
jgi:hypothetical protein